MNLQSFDEPGAREFRVRIRSWLRSVVPPEWNTAKLSADAPKMVELSRQWNQILYEGGFAAIGWPKEHGGAGLGPVEQLIFTEEAGKAHAPDGFGRVQRLMAGSTLLAHGTQEQCARFLPGILSGEQQWCQGFSEPNAGSDIASLETFGVRVDGGYRLTGEKVWTSLASQADRSLLLAKTSRDAPRYRNLTLFLVDLRQPGVRVRPIRGINGNPTRLNSVKLQDAYVDASDVVGRENDGWRVAVGVLSYERGLDFWTKCYLEYRLQVDQLIQCAEHAPHANPSEATRMRSQLELLEWHMRRVIEIGQANGEWFPAFSVAKVAHTEFGVELAQIGLSFACPAHERFWRQSHLESIEGMLGGGTSEIQRNVIADRVLNLPRA